ncbi:MAG: hypothetical protein NVS2B17_11990 [Candidatus Velthaea sp.]
MVSVPPLITLGALNAALGAIALEATAAAAALVTNLDRFIGLSFGSNATLFRATMRRRGSELLMAKGTLHGDERGARRAPTSDILHLALLQ